ncbi:MAG: hypothetical protein GC200_01480 [Tepidisphaera sp.]|nr:hypothetical protein [Tepidisphaera sp.]
MFRQPRQYPETFVRERLTMFLAGAVCFWLLRGDDLIAVVLRHFPALQGVPAVARAVFLGVMLVVGLLVMVSPSIVAVYAPKQAAAWQRVLWPLYATPAEQASSRAGLWCVGLSIAAVMLAFVLEAAMSSVLPVIVLGIGAIVPWVVLRKSIFGARETFRRSLAALRDGGYRVCPQCAYPLPAEPVSEITCAECGSFHTPKSLQDSWEDRYYTIAKRYGMLLAEPEPSLGEWTRWGPGSDRWSSRAEEIESRLIIEMRRLCNSERQHYVEHELVTLLQPLATTDHAAICSVLAGWLSGHRAAQVTDGYGNPFSPALVRTAALSLVQQLHLKELRAVLIEMLCAAGAVGQMSMAERERIRGIVNELA